MKDPSAKRKVVVRHLPPSLSQSDLLSQIDSRFGDSYNWFSFRPGKSNYKTQKHSRAYFGFKAPENVYEFAAFLNGHVFVNEKGAQFKAIVEYAPSQRVPKPCDKKDPHPREGSITKDPDYLEFLKLIAQPAENLPSAEIQLERREAEQSGASKPAPIVTPLMEFIRQKRATVIGSQGVLDVRRGGRRSRAVSANKPSSRPSKRNSEKKKYVEKDNSKSVRSSKQDNSSGKDIPVAETASVMDSSLPGIALTMESGKKKILLLKKDRDNHVNSPPQPEQQIETNLTRSSSTSRQNQKIEVGGRFIKGILVRNEPRPSQSSTFVQPEPRVEPSEAENGKRPPRAGKDYRISGTNSEKQERRPRNKDRPDRVVWAPLRRADGSNNNEDQLSSSAANNGEVKQRALLLRSGEVVNSSDGHSLENESSLALGNLENVDGSFYGSSDEEPSEAYSMNKDTENRREKFHMLGYRDGISAGQEAAAQEGYNVGYKESVLNGYKFGIVRGVSSALAFLPDDLREKLIDEQETREKFRKLHGSVHDLSTEAALKLFYGALTAKQGKEKSREEGPDSSSGSVSATNDLGSYVTNLGSLLDKSPKIKVRLDT